MTIRRFVVPITTDNQGAAEVFSPVFSGKLISFRYIKTDFADTVDFVLTAEATGATLWSEENVTASVTRHPRAPTHTTAGAAATYDGTYAVNARIALASDRVKIVIANAGDTKTGALHITIDG